LALGPRELRLEPLDVPEPGRGAPARRTDRPHDTGLDRGTDIAEERTPLYEGRAGEAEQFPAQEVDRTTGASALRDRSLHDAGDERRGRGASEGTLGAVMDDGAEMRLRIGNELDERAHRHARFDVCDRGRESVGRPREDRPERW